MHYLEINTVQYEWSTDKAGDIRELEEKLISGDMQIEGHYNAKKNETRIKSLLKEDDDEKDIAKNILPGLVLVNTTTNNGVLMAQY